MAYDAQHRIQTERQRQVMELGHTHQKDARHTGGWLGQLAYVYETGKEPAKPEGLSPDVLKAKAELPELERLTKAAALYEAERERIGRRLAAIRRRMDELANPNARRIPRG